MNAPIILCHYGNSGYLPYVLKALAHTNPEKEIILLGDDSNQWLNCIKGVEHLHFNAFEFGDELAVFNEVYQLVKGGTSGHMKKGRDWVNFVFKRWYYVYNFLNSRSVTNFWHFDSDNMILDSLSRHEHKFKHHDFTEQCNGSCMNGYVSSPEFVRQYLNKINHLFQDNAYLDGLRTTFQDRTDHAFTEMAAYKAYRDQDSDHPVNPTRLNSVIDGSSFDDCICQEHGMKMESFLAVKQIKLITCTDDGRFYCFPQDGSGSVRLNSINLSWVPTDLFAVVLRQLVQGSPPFSSELPANVESLPTLTQLFCSQHRAKALFIRGKRLLRDIRSRS